MESNNLQEQWTASEIGVIYKPGYRTENPLMNSLATYMFLRSIWNPEILHLQSHCVALFLDRRGRAIAFRAISTGSMSSVTPDRRLIACLAVRTLADSVITAVSRPSGNVKPNDSDLSLVNKLKDGLDLLDIKLLDHFIISGSNYLSFYDEKLLGEWPMP